VELETQRDLPTVLTPLHCCYKCQASENSFLRPPFFRFRSYLLRTTRDCLDEFLSDLSDMERMTHCCCRQRRSRFRVEKTDAEQLYFKLIHENRNLLFRHYLSPLDFKELVTIMAAFYAPVVLMTHALFADSKDSSTYFARQKTRRRRAPLTLPKSQEIT
jgi:hypothetical protein